MLYLFTKKLCSTCQDAKAVIAKAGLDVRIMELDADSQADRREALSELAWWELVEAAEKELPILVELTGRGSGVRRSIFIGAGVVNRLADLAQERAA